MHTPVFADTTVGGDITTDTTWNVAGSPYIVTSSIYIYSSSGAAPVLTIQPGVTVKFNQDTGLYIGYSGAGGALNAVGTEAAPIIFTSNQPAPTAGFWQGIYFSDETIDASTVLDFVTVQYGGGSGGNLYLDHASPTIKNSSILSSSSDGIYLFVSSAAIQNTTVDGASYGIQGDGSPTITNSVIRNTSNYGVRLSGTPTVTDSNIEKGFYLTDSGTITGNTIFNSTNYPIRVKANLVEQILNQNTIENIQPGDTFSVLQGQISSSATWKNIGLTYIASSIYVYSSSGNTPVLTIEPGVTIKFGGLSGLYIGNGSTEPGALNAVGTASSPITFTLHQIPDGYFWHGINFSDATADASTVLDYVIIERAGADGSSNLNIENASPTIKNSIIRSSPRNGIQLLNSNPIIENTIIDGATFGGGEYGINGSGSPVLTNCTIRNTANYGLYLTSGSPSIIGSSIEKGIYINSNSGTITGNTFTYATGYPIQVGQNLVGQVVSNNTIQNIQPGDVLNVLGGQIISSGTWKNVGLTYVATATISIYSASGTGPVLTVEPGVVIQFNLNTGLDVGSIDNVSYAGALKASGTESAPIVFTSYQGTPTAGYWNGIKFYTGTVLARTELKYVTVEYAGAGPNINYRGSIQLYNCSPTIANSIIRRSSSYGINLSGANPTIQNTMIDGATHGIYGWGSPNITNSIIKNIGSYAIMLTSDSSAISVIGSTLEKGIYLSDNSGTITGNTITNSGADPIKVGAGLVGQVVSQNTITNIQPGDYLQVMGGQVSSSETWRKNGLLYYVTASVYVYNTSEPAPMLTIEPGVTFAFSSSANMYIGRSSTTAYPGSLYANGAENEPIQFDFNNGGLFIDGSAGGPASTLNYVISQYGTSGIGVSSASPTISNSILRYNRNGISVSGITATPLITGCFISDNTYGVYASSSAGPILHGNDIFNNSSYGVYNTSTSPIIDAGNNWWGDASGPNHATTNPSGLGNKVSDFVNFSPWLTESITVDRIAPVPPTVTSALFTKNISYTLTGTKEANSSVIFNGTTVVPINPSTSWQYQVTLVNGQNTYSISSADASDNVSSPVPVTVTLDTSAPTPPTVNEYPALTRHATVTLTGTKEINSSILIENTTVVPVNSSTGWQYDVQLTHEGQYDFTISSEDAAGNRSTSTSVSVVRDTTPPRIASSLMTFSKMSGGGFHSAAIASDGTLWTWGDNEFGQLGDGTGESRSNPAQVGSDNTWTAIAAGDYHTIALKSDGTLWAWGDNSDGQLGDGTRIERDTPVRIGSDTDWIAISAGVAHNLALKSEGSLWAWGANDEYQLGNGDIGPSLYPIQILAVVPDSPALDSFDCGYWFSLALRSNGQLLAWGNNQYGALGDGTTHWIEIPTSTTPGFDWSSIAGGGYFSLGIRADGTIWAWGDNSGGELGDGTTEDHYVPGQVGTDSDWATISAGYGHVLALKTNGTLWSWGGYGAIGDGIGADVYLPTQLAVESTWTAISAGDAHSLGLKSDHTLWTWGLNECGQLGDGSTDWQPIPTQVNLGGNVQINQGAAFTNSAAVMVSFTAVDENGVEEVQFSNDNVSWSVPVPYADTKNWTLSGGDGIKTVYVRFKDTAGNWSASYVDKIVLDTAAPMITITSPVGVASTSRPQLTFTAANDWHSIIVTVDGVVNERMIDSGEYFDELADGRHTVRVDITDQAGNTGFAEETFMVVTVPPFVEMSSPSPHKAETVIFTLTFAEEMLTSVQPVVTFTAGGSTYSITGAWQDSLIWQGSYTFTSSIGDGTYTFNVSGAQTAAGVTVPARELPAYFAVDATAPSVPGVTSPLAVRNNQYLFTGTKETNSSVLINGSMVVPVNASTSWQYPVTLAEGPNAFTIASRDAVDNTSAPVPVTVTLDTMPPVIESSIPAHNSDTGSSVTSIAIVLRDTHSAINLSASLQGATVKNGNNQLIAGNWATSGTNTLIFTPGSALRPNTYQVTISPVDVLENSSQQQISFTKHDATAPVTSVSLAGTLGQDGWYSTPVAVTLTADDGIDGIGVAGTEYSIDGMNWQTYTAPFTLSTDGRASLQYRSSDLAANTELSRTSEIKINQTGLVGLWHMDNDWNDSSVVKNDGTATGAGFSTDARIGSHAGNFDGANDFISLSQNIPDMTSCTIEAWINYKGTGNSTIFSDSTQVIGNDFFIGVDATNVYIKANKSGAALTNSTGYLGSEKINLEIDISNSWHHIVWVMTNSDSKVYIDGIWKGTVNKSGSNVGYHAPNPSIASWWDNGGVARQAFFKGLIDELTLYKRALTAEEVLEHYLPYSVDAPVVETVPATTASATLTLRGQKPANTGIKVNGITIVAVDGQPTWEGIYTLNPGPNTLDVIAFDASGYTSRSVTLSVTLDNAGPVLGTTVPAAGAVVNAVNTISVTFTDVYSSVDLNGSLSDASVKNTAGNDVSGSWAVSDNMLVFSPTGTLGSDTYTVTLAPIDSLGNRRTVNFSFSLDNSAPVIQMLTMNPTSPHRAESVTFNITFNENMSTVQPTVTFTRGLLYSTYTLTGGWINARTWQGTYPFTTGTGDGTYILTVANAKDTVLNTMETVEAGTFVLDTSAPSNPGVNQVTTPTNNRNQILTGTKEAGSAIFINGAQRVPADANAAWSFSYPLGEGTNNLNIIARDAAGNDSPATVTTIALDTTPPVFTVNTYQNPSPNPTQTLTGTKDAGCTVTLNGTQIIGPSDTGTTWSYTVDLTSGITNHFTFIAADDIGNTITRNVDIFYDTAPPAALPAGALTANGNGRGTEITLSWTGYVETTDVAYYAIYKSTSPFDTVAQMTPLTTVNKGIKTYTVSGLTTGATYYFAVVAVDPAGNKVDLVSTVSETPADAMAPEDITALAATAGYNSTQGNFITLTWNRSANTAGDLADQMVYVDSGTGYDSGTSIGTAAVIYTKSGLNDATNYKFKIAVKDASHESTGRIIEAMTRLANPANLQGTPGNSKATLNWTAVTGPVKQYNVYRAIGEAPRTDISSMSFVKSVTGTTYTDTGLTNDTTYQYAVTTTNTFGAERTDVQSISVTPRSDATGPVIDSFSVIAKQVIATPVTITAAAHDFNNESPMGSMELFIDGTSVKAQTGGTLSYAWNVVSTTDGNHSIKLKATDSLGNATEETRTVIVSLAAPVTPAITSHSVTQTTPVYTVTVSGTAALYTTVTLSVNGSVVNQTQTAEGTAFNFSGVTLAEGDNILTVKASHRGGESPYSAGYTITVDTGAPATPQNLAAQIMPGGLVRFTWTNGTGELPAGYNLYMATSSFTSTAGATKTNTTPITYQYKEHNPGDDNLKHYAVTAVDSTGNESAISNVVSISSDREAPSVSPIVYTYTPITGEGGGEGVSVAGIGTVKVSITVSEPLKELPFFSLEPQEGSPIVLSMAKVDNLHYEGSFSITADSPHGPTTYKFSGKDLAGNRGNREAVGIEIDIKGPVASILSPVTVLQITPDPVPVQIAFDEPAQSLPMIGIKAADGSTVPVTALSTTDNGYHWSGNIDISTMPAGQAEFVLAEAKDQLGNISTLVSGGKNILLYTGTVPPPGVPDGLTATPTKAGAVSLKWNTVIYSELNTAPVTYNLYRRAEGENTPTRIQAGIVDPAPNSSLLTPHSIETQDTPDQDGTYYYSVTSVGLLNSESQPSTEVQAASDRTGPEAPASLALALTGNGVSATWTAPAGPEPAARYNLYRSNSGINSIAGLTPVATTTTLTAVDPAPMKAYPFYAVASVDVLGNIGAASASREIAYPVSPVTNLVLQKIETAAPEIKWDAPADGSIIGYYLYRNDSRIINTPITDRAYTDTYYSGGTSTYAVTAVDSDGNESPKKTVTLPDLTMGLKDGTTLRRGLLETAQIVITNSSANPISVGTLDITVGEAPKSSLTGPLDVPAAGQLQIGKVLATTANAPSTVPVVLTATWSPAPGTTVRVFRTTTAGVTGSSTAFEIYSDPLVRTTDARVRIKVNNLGSSQMEFLTSESNGPTSKVRVNLKDQDGNILASGKLNQRTGAVVNIGSAAVARLNPGESFTSEPIAFTVPASAPYAVTIEAVIENTYYHYSKPDQVTAPGMTQTITTSISETSYRATAASDKTFYTSGQPVIITGRAISNTGSGVQGPGSEMLMPHAPVKIGISSRGFDRFFTVSSDASGMFSYAFTPGANEAGTYNLWAVHPDVTTRAVQATFTIGGVRIEPQVANWRMVKGGTADIPVKLTNTGEVSLSDLQFNTEGSTGIFTEVINPGDTMLMPGEAQSVTLRVTAGSSAPDTGYATLFASVSHVEPGNPTPELISVRMDANLTLVTAIPIISTSPSYVETGIVREKEKIASFTIKNTGADTLRNARIEGPSSSWMSLTLDKNLGNIGAGESKSIGIYLKPGANIAQDIYDDQIVIYSDNHIPYTYHIKVTVTSNDGGSVLFDALNELNEDVGNATIVFQHQTLMDLVYTVQTGADGTAMQYDIPEGRYIFNISASGHKGFSGTFTITPGLITTVPIALEVTLVDVQWSVTPVVIEDRYEITVTQTFQTNVPTPVLVSEPASITVPELKPGDVFNGEYIVTNYGLIAVDDVNIKFPTSFGEYDVELLAAIPKSINAMQRVTIPYRITRRITTTAWNTGDNPLYASLSASDDALASLLAEVHGYGGSCYDSFSVTVSGTAVICSGALNERSVTKETSYAIVTPIPGSSCGGTGGSTGGGFPNVPPYGGGTGTGTGQSGGGSLPGTSGPMTSLPGDEGCVTPQCPDDDCDKRCDTCVNTGSQLDIGNGSYNFTETDLKIPAKSIPIDMSRTYRSNQIMRADDKWVFAAPMDGPLGYGWHSPWFARAGDGSYLDGKGNYYTFTKDSVGKYLPHAKNGMILKKTDTGYEVSKRGENTYLFNSNGMLSGIRDARGNTVTLVYEGENVTSVRDVMDRLVLAFSYDANNHVTSVTDIAGRIVTYEYDSYGNLTKTILTTPNGSPITLHTYEYDTTEYPVPPISCSYRNASGLICEGSSCYQGSIYGYVCETRLIENQQNNYHSLIKKTNAAGESYQIAYKAQWRSKGIVEKITDPAGRTMTNTPSFGTKTFYNTDYAGRKFKRQVNDAGKLTLLSEIDVQGVEQVIKRIEYLSDRVEKTTDVLGNVTAVQKDEWDNVIKKIDAAGYEWKYTYTSDNKMLSMTDPLGTVTRYEYDEFGNKTKEIIAAGTPDESVSTYAYDQYNQLTSVTKSEAITSYEYNTAGQLAKITNPLGNSTSMSYDTAGNIAIRTQPLIGDTLYSDYDYKGNPGKVTDPNGNSIVYTYDALGRIAAVTNQADNSTTQYFYVTNAPCSTGGCDSNGGNGKIDYIILPEGNRIDYDYDISGNLTKIIDNNGNNINFEYDKNRNRIKEDIRDANGVLQRTVSYSFDLLKRQIKTTNPDNSFAESGYDSRGNRILFRNLNSSVTTYTYDKLNRLTDTIHPDSNTTSYIYNRRSNLTGVTDAGNITTIYQYDSRNRISKSISPDTGITMYTYDVNGNLKTKTDAKAVTITYFYDALNRLTTIDFPTDTDIVYTYDSCGNGKGLICSMTDSSGAVSYEYTERGQLKKETKVIDGVTYITQYAYDKNGNLKKIIYPSGRLITYAYSNDQATSVLNNAAILASNLNYKPFGEMQSIMYGNSAQGTFNFDGQYRLIQIGIVHPVSDIMQISQEYDANGNIQGIIDALDFTKNRSFTYDARDRLLTANGFWGSLVWSYDGIANRQTQTGDGTSIYAYQTGTNKLASITGADVSNFTYDVSGNTATENAREFIYDQNQRLKRVIDGGVITGEYTYNGNGQRVKKIVSGVTTIFHFDLRGQLMAESTNSGQINAEYVYLNSQPFVKIEGNNVYYYHNDHLATPRKMTDASGSVVWSADYKPFGEAAVTVSTISNNLRFPGQYYDAETGLNYNYHRNYNSRIGRFIESDPIGIKSGENHLYNYAQANPIINIDPTGLDTVGCNGVPDKMETPCRLECCAEHDECYDKFNCSAQSFLDDFECNSEECDECNSKVKKCFWRCGSKKDDDPDRPNYYCASQNKYVKIPGDFPDRATAEVACNYDHTQDRPDGPGIDVDTDDLLN